MIGYQHELVHVADSRKRVHSNKPTPLGKALSELAGRVLGFRRSRGDGWNIKVMAPGHNPPPAPEAPAGTDLTGDAKALGELFSRPSYVPQGVKLTLSRLERQRARKQRLVNYQFAVRVAFRAKALERFGIGVRGDDATIANDRRLLRNARKRERQERS